jgi:hypothetical protein
MRAGVSRFVLVWLLVLAVVFLSGVADHQPLVFFDQPGDGLLIGTREITAPSAIALGRHDNCNDVSCG